MWYILMFGAIAVLLVVVVLLRIGRTSGMAKSPTPAGTAGASRTPSGSRQRRERKKRRAQSRHDRRKRH
jgi:hypothetical protein